MLQQHLKIGFIENKIPIHSNYMGKMTKARKIELLLLNNNDIFRSCYFDTENFTVKITSYCDVTSCIAGSI